MFRELVGILKVSKASAFFWKRLHGAMKDLAKLDRFQRSLQLFYGLGGQLQLSL
jgi:hypothetical protein